MKRPIITEEELSAAQQEFFASVRALQVAEGKEQTTCETCGRHKSPFELYRRAKQNPRDALIEVWVGLTTLRSAVRNNCISREELLDALRVLQFTAGGI